MYTVVQRELELGLVVSPERSIPVPAQLSYRTDDPYAIHFTFHIGSDSPSTGRSPANCSSRASSGRAVTAMCGCGRRRSTAAAWSA